MENARKQVSGLEAAIAAMIVSGMDENSPEVTTLRGSLAKAKRNAQEAPIAAGCFIVVADVVVPSPRGGLISQRRLEERLAQFNKGEWVTLEWDHDDGRVRGIVVPPFDCMDHGSAI